MKRLFNNLLITDNSNWAALFARLAIAIAIFPHGAQKLLGWYGGNGFLGTMEFMTEVIGAPLILGFLVIIVEFFCSLMLLLGVWTRIAAISIAFNFIGVLIVDIIGNGFFMNWAGIEGQGEGYEYFILLFGLIFISIMYGGGKFSVDSRLSNRRRRMF